MTASAIRTHGAKTVYDAACSALEGDYSKLAALGLNVTTMGEAWRIQTSAYKSMTAGQRAEEQMAVNAKLAQADRQAKSREARAKAGGKQIAVMLTPGAAAKLADHVAKGESIAGVINRLLERSRP